MMKKTVKAFITTDLPTADPDLLIRAVDGEFGDFFHHLLHLWYHKLLGKDCLKAQSIHYKKKSPILLAF